MAVESEAGWKGGKGEGKRNGGGGQVLFPPEPTISTGGTLDFAVCHIKLLAITKCEVLWNTPFKPHAAVRYTLRIQSAQMPVLQAPVFPKNVLESISDIPRPEDPDFCAILLEPDTKRPHDLSWGGFMKWIESSTCEGGATGRGWHVQCTVAPLLPSQAPLPSWKGALLAYWTRVRTWVQAYDKQALNPKIKPVLLKALSTASYDFELEGVCTQALRLTLHKAVCGNQQLLEEQSKLLVKEADKHMLTQDQEEYKAWLAVACEGGMRGLYKAIKSPETNLLRPYRDQALEIRPHLRRAEWRDLWIGPRSDGQALQTTLSSLKADAVVQRQAWKDIDPWQLKKKTIKLMADKTGGPDGLTVSMLKNLSDAQLGELATHLNHWETTGQMPLMVTTSLVAMLPKKIDKERPIALTSMAYRLWCKARWDKFQTWSAQYSVSSPWDRAQKGSSSLDISLKRLITYEGIKARNIGITLLLDLKEFYEHVDLHQLANQANKHGFPAVLLQGALQVYTGPRYIQGEACLSAPIRAERGIMASCPYAVGLSKLALHPVMHELWRNPALQNLDLFVDDSGYDVEHRNPEKCASNAYKLWKDVKDKFQQINMPISVGKAAWVCSSKQLEDKLKDYLRPGDPKIQPLWSDLGVDCAGGKRRRVAAQAAYSQRKKESRKTRRTAGGQKADGESKPGVDPRSCPLWP